MKVKDIIKLLADFNPNAEIEVEVGSEPITGIQNWGTGSKFNTKKVILKTSKLAKRNSEINKVAEKVKKIIADVLNVDFADVIDETTTLTSLYADSLDLVEIAMGLENEFNIKIQDDSFDSHNVITVGDVIELVKSKL